jgi:hypothetical protein
MELIATVTAARFGPSPGNSIQGCMLGLQRLTPPEELSLACAVWRRALDWEFLRGHTMLESMQAPRAEARDWPSCSLRARSRRHEPAQRSPQRHEIPHLLFKIHQNIRIPRNGPGPK